MKCGNPFDFFDAIYCLTTDERYRKYESALNMFRSIGIEDRIIKFNGSEVDRIYGFSGPKDLNTYQTLASASHLEIWKKAHKEGLSNVLIFEDDVAFDNWDHAALEDAINNLKTTDWEIFYLGYDLYGATGDVKDVGHHLVELQKGADVRSTHAYSLNGTTFQKILNYKPFQEPVVDQWLPKQLNIHCLVPLMSVQQQNYKGNWKRGLFRRNFSRNFKRVQSD